MSNTQQIELVTTAALAQFNVAKPRAAVVAASPINHPRSGLTSVDGVAIADGDRVLLPAQSDPEKNGVYIAAADAWGRAADLSAPADFLGSSIYVSQGDTLARRVFYVTSEVATVDTDPVTLIVTETGDDILAAIAELEAQTASAVAAAEAQTAQALTDFDADANTALSEFQVQAAQAAAGLNFAATIDPAAVNPVGGNGGTYTTIADAVAASSPGQRVVLNLPGGSAGSVPFASDVDIEGNRHLVLVGPKNNPAVVNHTVKDISSRNALCGFRMFDTCTVTTVEVQHTHGALAIPGQKFRENTSVYTGETGWIGGVSLYDFGFSGEQEACLIGFNGVACARVVLRSGTLSGVVTGIGRTVLVNPFVMAGTQGVQLQNGAAMLNRFSLGGNIVGTV
ncbi:hypothetical protein [Loktanella sp. 3ANDIMAR09]|uniref:hypothetical protein n=1 Tax=Loktanella sp. 3ANDIMAR09 TaxID=1225657 RepID=UPI0006FE63D0|nr:hypothetical protein [Loktanella sp. 3ANDIMAR09]